MTLVDRTCHCGKTFKAKEADVRRGWAKCCSKRCAAVARERKLDRFGFQRGESGTFQSRMADRRERAEDPDRIAGMDAREAGWDGHKGTF